MSGESALMYRDPVTGGFVPFVSVGLQGPAGPVGPQGPAGPQGAQGTNINVLGSVDSSSQLPASAGAAGDALFVKDTGDLWVWDGSQWVDVGKVQGPAGPKGEPGTDGADGAPGARGLTGPQGAAGPPGPSAVSTDAGNMAVVGADGLIFVPSMSWTGTQEEYDLIDPKVPGVVYAIVQEELPPFECAEWDNYATGPSLIPMNAESGAVGVDSGTGGPIVNGTAGWDGRYIVIDAEFSATAGFAGIVIPNTAPMMQWPQMAHPDPWVPGRLDTWFCVGQAVKYTTSVPGGTLQAKAGDQVPITKMVMATMFFWDGPGGEQADWDGLWLAECAMDQQAVLPDYCAVMDVVIGVLDTSADPNVPTTTPGSWASVTLGFASSEGNSLAIFNECQVSGRFVSSFTMDMARAMPLPAQDDFEPDPFGKELAIAKRNALRFILKYRKQLLAGDQEAVLASGDPALVERHWDETEARFLNDVEFFVKHITGGA